VEERWQNEAYTVDAAVVATRAQTVEEFKDAQLRLPLISRTAVVLHDMEGLTVAEIARIQEIGLPAAKQRLRRGRMMLVSAPARGAERRVADAVCRRPVGKAPSQVSDYLDDSLPTRDRAPLETHLGSCATLSPRCKRHCWRLATPWVCCATPMR